MIGSKFKNSSLRYVLEGLIPYTDANIRLSFKPASFFRELEKRSGKSHSAIKNAYYQAQRDGLINSPRSPEEFPLITPAGYIKLQPYIAQRLDKSAKLMVVFDIPEEQRSLRRSLRLLLAELHFKQVQKSVWVSKYDFREYLKKEINKSGLKPYVQLFEVAEL